MHNIKLEKMFYVYKMSYTRSIQSQFTRAKAYYIRLSIYCAWKSNKTCVFLLQRYVKGKYKLHVSLAILGYGQKNVVSIDKDVMILQIPDLI